MVLTRSDVLDAFKKAKVTLMIADWTSRDDQITAEINRLGRNGVPVYALYPASIDGVQIPDTQVWPEILTPGLVLERIQLLKK